MTADPRAKGDPLEPPAQPRHLQVLRVADGWLWRMSTRGEVWSPWLLARSRRQLRRVCRRFRPELVEVLT
jgi:hypothetical protein